MAKRNRLLKGAICMALTGDAQGECGEDPAEIRQLDESGSESESAAASEGEEQEHANNISNKQYPLAHRCLSNTEFRHNDLFESVLDRAKEVTMLVQDEKKGWGEGMDIGVAWLAVKEMRDEACAERLEIVSGAGNDEIWKEISGTSLPPMFQKFRKVFAKELTKRFQLDTTPSRHVQLALQMNPTVNVSADGPLLANKSAFHECMTGEYRRALKRQALLQQAARRPAATRRARRAALRADFARRAGFVLRELLLLLRARLGCGRRKGCAPLPWVIGYVVILLVPVAAQPVADKVMLRVLNAWHPHLQPL